jgi:excisionase family DNA binding protein
MEVLRMLTLAEAAALLNLSPDTLRRQAQRGKLRGQKYGKTWVVSQREVDRYARENRKLA